MRPSRRGFTLVELSIVLVILGLLVGAVVAGESLIHSAELKGVMREAQQYQSAVSEFRTQYTAMPGDMKNAVSYWGAQAGATTDGVDATCAALTSPATGAATCNGDGNGRIAVFASSSNNHEMWRAWQHLSNAGLIEGSSSGVSGPGGALHVVPGTNAPASKLSAAGWSIWYLGSYGDANTYTANYGNVLLFGRPTTTSYNATAALVPDDAYNIDKKLDDGAPHSGKILAAKYAYQPNCVESTDDAYKLTGTAAGCSLYFITGY